jgi:PhnB protein
VPHGFSTITPFVVVADPAGAAEFYQDVLGAELLALSEAGGVVVHVELALATGHLQLGSAGPAFHLVPAPDGDDACYSFGFYCPDVDAVLTTALDRGATLREPLTTFASGDRYASIRDPFGVRWSLMTRGEDLSPEESTARVKEWVTANTQPAATSHRSIG